jgi:hypothetical protein
MISLQQNTESKKSLSKTHYVEVVYLKGGLPQSRKLQSYTEEEAARMYMRTINKFTTEKTKALICLRTEEHDLIKSELLK